LEAAFPSLKGFSQFGSRVRGYTGYALAHVNDSYVK